MDFVRSAAWALGGTRYGTRWPAQGLKAKVTQGLKAKVAQGAHKVLTKEANLCELRRPAILSRFRKAKGKKELDTLSFLKLVKEKSAELGIDEKILTRQLNVGFSGGEKKRYEILQMALLEPQLAVLDETDSGLDVDALKIVSEGVNLLRDENRSMLVITHYQRLLNHIVPDYVHILADGKIRRSGGKELALEVEESGYAGIDDAA